MMTTPAPRKERRKNHDSSRAPTSPTPNGVICMAVCACAPFSPKAETLPEGVTVPPAPSATIAAVMGPSEAAASAPSRCRPSAAVPAIPISAQLTEATADNSTSPHGTLLALPPWCMVPMLIARPPDQRRGDPAHVPLVWDYHSPGRFQPRQRIRATRPSPTFTRPDFRSGGLN